MKFMSTAWRGGIASADIADTERAQHPADEANAHMLAAGGKPAWALPGQLVPSPSAFRELPE